MTTEIADNRDLALKIGYAATDWLDYISYEDYARIASDWDMAVLMRDNIPIGAIFRKNGETHVSIVPEWRKRWLTKGLLKELLSGTKFTKIAAGHDFMYNVLGRLGFVPQADGTVAREQ